MNILKRLFAKEQKPKTLSEIRQEALELGLKNGHFVSGHCVTSSQMDEYARELGLLPPKE